MRFSDIGPQPSFSPTPSCDLQTEPRAPPSACPIVEPWPARARPRIMRLRRRAAQMWAKLSALDFQGHQYAQYSNVVRYCSSRAESVMARNGPTRRISGAAGILPGPCVPSHRVKPIRIVSGDDHAMWMSPTDCPTHSIVIVSPGSSAIVPGEDPNPESDQTRTSLDRSEAWNSWNVSPDAPDAVKSYATGAHGPDWASADDPSWADAASKVVCASGCADASLVPGASGATNGDASQ